ncbi:MAG: ArsR family transcriptional regulator [Lachnospiraceae bacterium]|nr:ArsR family transcriptional regulator [Lachnospiraceae bacterium]
MVHISNLKDGLELFKALGSDIRVHIISILLDEGPMSMNKLAAHLKITNGALTGHIKKLEECGIINISNETSGHGNQKICSVMQDKILIDFDTPIDYSNTYTANIKIGQFSTHKIYPTCGLATDTAVIGELDDIRYFDHPDRFKADIMWFTKGYVEYSVPNLIPVGNRITQISFSAEISSEAPGIDNNWPSDISFYINDRLLGVWTSPGDYGDVHGVFTPSWWPPNWNQYGLLKLIVINRHGTFLDGLKISDVSSNDLKLDYTSTIRLKMAVEDGARHIGGLTLFGKSFGNYDQDINVNLSYTPI